MTDNSARALAAADRLGLDYEVTRHGPVRSLQEAAAARGVEPAAIVKTLVVRITDEDFRLVLVPGDREISWPKLRGLLGVNKLQLPDASLALAATGYERGTITPLGSTTPWPVVVDATIRGRRVSMGAGEHGRSLFVDADDLVRAFDATVADITDPE
jgi:Cys-tRNA(Pro)/Cys-tRNA(Cys) deacylase